MDLRQLREKAGLLSFEEAAFKIGVSLSTLRAWESARGEPSTTEKIAKLMELYNCSFEDIRKAVAETKSKAQSSRKKSA